MWLPTTRPRETRYNLLLFLVKISPSYFQKKTTKVHTYIIKLYALCTCLPASAVVVVDRPFRKKPANRFTWLLTFALPPCALASSSVPRRSTSNLSDLCIEETDCDRRIRISTHTIDDIRAIMTRPRRSSAASEESSVTARDQVRDHLIWMSRTSRARHGGQLWSTQGADYGLINRSWAACMTTWPRSYY